MINAVAQLPESQLMMSAVVYVQRANGRNTRARALLDTCSTANFVTAELAKRLGLPCQPCEVSVGSIEILMNRVRRDINDGCTV